MSKDWENEPWRKRYVNETAEDLALTWQARALWDRILIKCDRKGLVMIKPSPRRSRLLSGLVLIPPDVVTPALAELLDDGRLVERGDGFFLPNHEAAQRARKSGAQRMRELRRRNAEERAAAGTRDETSRTGDVSSRTRAETHESVLNRREEITTRKAPAARAPVARSPRRALAVAAVFQREPVQFSETATATTRKAPSAKYEGTPKQLDVLDYWNGQREGLGMSQEVLTAKTGGQLQELLDHASAKRGEDADLVIGRMIRDFLRSDMRSKRLSTFLQESVWPARFDSACADVSAEQERADVARRKGSYR